MNSQTISILVGLFTLVLSDPCFNIRRDKNDGLKIFTPSTGGIRTHDIALLAKRKRSINEGGFVQIINSQLYSDDNDLLSGIRRKVYLPLYVLRNKRFIQTRSKRAAAVECPWQDGSISSTGTDFYAKKPSDIKTVDVSISDNVETKKDHVNVDGKIDGINIDDDSVNLRNKEGNDRQEEDDEEEDIKTAANTIVFKPLFAYRRKYYKERL